MMIDNTTALTQQIESVMLELVELNNRGVQLLGEGRLELARTAIYHATDRIQQVRDAQTQLEAVMSRQYHDHQHHRNHPLNLVLGVQGHCFVTPLERVNNNDGVTIMVDPMTSHEYGPVPQSTQASSSTTFVASTTSNEQDTSHQERTAASSSSSNETGEQHAIGPSSSQHEAVQAESLSSSSTKTSLSPSLSDDVQEQKSPNSPPPPQQQPLMMHLYAFLRPIFFSAQDFLHVVNPPLTHLSICLSFNLAVVNHKLAIRYMQQSSSSAVDGENLDHDNEDDDDDHRGRRQRMLVPLYEAIYLYKLAYRLQMENGMVEVSRLHTLGMVNNLGQLYYHAEMYTASRDCYQTLLEMITIHRVREEGTWLRLNNANLFILGDIRSGSGDESLLQRLQHQQLLLQQQEQQQQQDAPYMELFLDNIFPKFWPILKLP